MVLLTAWKMLAYRRKHGSTVFQFDHDNILVTTGLYKATIDWAAINKVRVIKEFIFLFASAGVIFILPRRAMLQGDEPALLTMASSRS